MKESRGETEPESGFNVQPCPLFHTTPPPPEPSNYACNPWLLFVKRGAVEEAVMFPKPIPGPALPGPPGPAKGHPCLTASFLPHDPMTPPASPPPSGPAGAQPSASRMMVFWWWE